MVHDKFSSQLENDNMEYAQLYLLRMIADIIIEQLQQNLCA